MATVSELLEYVRRRTNDSTWTKDVAVQRDIIRQALKRLCRARHWSFFRIRESINLTAPYTTGTVSLTDGSITVTGSGTTFESAMVGKFFQLDGDQVAYKIAAVNSGTEIELDAQYVNAGGDNVTASAYQIIYPDYTLTNDVAKIVAIVHQELQVDLALTSADQMDTWIRSQNYTGTPLYFCPITNDANSQKVRLFPAPDRQYPLVVIYDRKPADPSTVDDTAEVDWPANEDVLEAACFYEACRSPMFPQTNKMFNVARAEYEETLALASNEDRTVAGAVEIQGGSRPYQYRYISITTTVTPP